MSQHEQAFNMYYCKNMKSKFKCTDIPNLGIFECKFYKQLVQDLCYSCFNTTYLSCVFIYNHEKLKDIIDIKYFTNTDSVSRFLSCGVKIDAFFEGLLNTVLHL